MKKIIQLIIFTLISLLLNISQSLADEKIKIGKGRVIFEGKNIAILNLNGPNFRTT